MDEERTMVQNAYGEDEGACEIANGSSLKAAKNKKKFGVVWMEISLVGAQGQREDHPKVAPHLPCETLPWETKPFASRLAR